jgi:ABC-type multidrug transport system fused ATPase/permease subunit
MASIASRRNAASSSGRPRTRQRARIVRNESDALTTDLIETFSNVEDVQANQGEVRQRKRIGARLESLRAANARVFGLYALSQSAGGLVSGFATLLVLAVGGSMTMRGSLTVGGLIAFVTAVGLLLRAMEDITYFGTQLRGTGAIASRVSEVLDAGTTIADGANAVPLEQVAPAIEFRGVRFGYDAGHPVLDGFTLEVPAGQRVGIVGASGSGKSTVVRLIQRFYDVHSGNVRVGDRNVRDLKLASLRSQIASVPQGPAILHASVRENITFGITERAPLVPGALAAVRLDVELADKGGDGYEIGAAGSNLSEGQKQRLAIARALVRDAPILLLDEVTSALDAVNQNAVQDALDELLTRGKRRTCIVIAHRLSTLRFVDRVVLLEGGRIVEDGSYDDLLSQKGRFAALHDALVADTTSGEVSRDERRARVESLEGHGS